MIEVKYSGQWLDQAEPLGHHLAQAAPRGPGVGELARELVRLGGMPAKAYVDAVHVALSAVHGLEYLLTWNCTHIANATMRSRIEAICREAGYEPPIICTPVELVEEK